MSDRVHLKQIERMLDVMTLVPLYGWGHPSGPFERVAAFGGPAAVLARLDRWRRAGPRFDPAPALVAAAEAAT